MKMRSCRLLIATTSLHLFETSSARTWMDCMDLASLANDGMPRAGKRKQIGAASEDSTVVPNDAYYEIEMHGTTTSLFEEVDPFRFTDSPSSVPSSHPSLSPSNLPSVFPSEIPTEFPSTSPSTYSPTTSPTYNPSYSPTSHPTYSVAYVPVNPKPGYFNYDEHSEYGPKNWEKVKVREGSRFWDDFDLEQSATDNFCGDGDHQSPIDVCTRPSASCIETHEFRPKSGDYKMESEFITKQILPSKLRLVMAPRTGEEPDPPQVDFSSNGRGILDMTNIDFKFPSEHTVCGNHFDGEMQYYVYHPGRKHFMAISFFLEASPSHPQNNHLQEVINAFRIQYKKDRQKCNLKQSQNLSESEVGFMKRNKDRHLQTISTSIEELEADMEVLLFDDDISFEAIAGSLNTTATGNMTKDSRRRLALKWHPFDPDIQKTVHFWGYKGSFTEPPCTDDAVSWRIMDVPTPISTKQLQQFKHILFHHVDEDCRRTSVHNSDGSVARPTQKTIKYYKCTRDDYVSDEEREVCGDEGCKTQFYGEGLNPYYPPLVHVTGPPTRSPSRK